MRISDIYKKYKIPPNLQDHMFRVTAVGMIVADNWNGQELNKEAIIITLLLHDMGNIIKFDFDNHPETLGEEINRINYWRKVKEEFIVKYGNDEHIAMNEIAKEIGVNPYILFLINNRGSSKFLSVIQSTDWNLKIASYVDFRVDPFGIVNVNQRFDDIKKRYTGTQHYLGNITEIEKKRQLCLELEELIQQYCLIDLETINNESIKEHIRALKEYEMVAAN